MCHSFVFHNDEVEIENNPNITKFSDDEEDSGNEDDDIPKEEEDNNDIGVNLNFLNRRLNVEPPRDVAEFVDLLSRPRAAEERAVIRDENEIVETLPVELLLKIFSYLDDISLWVASEVCKKWQEILRQNIPQPYFKHRTRERFPLFQQITTISNWMNVYCALMKSCFCRTCLIQMANKTPIAGGVNHLRARRLRNDIRSLAQEESSGIGK